MAPGRPRTMHHRGGGDGAVLAAVAALLLCALSGAVAHMCLLSPPQRGSLDAVNVPGPRRPAAATCATAPDADAARAPAASICGRTVGPCGEMAAVVRAARVPLRPTVDRSC